MVRLMSRTSNLSVECCCVEAGVVQAVKDSSEALAYVFTYNLHPN